jgi:Low affinity iron permease
VVAALTLTMVFVIQHTQARHQRATQRKLDEILLAMPGTDNSLLRLEHASDDELRTAGDQHREIRQATLMAIPGLVQPTQRKKIRLSVIPAIETRMAAAFDRLREAAAAHDTSELNDTATLS